MTRKMSDPISTRGGEFYAALDSLLDTFLPLRARNIVKLGIKEKILITCQVTIH